MNLELRPCNDDDYDFCWLAKKAAMGPHIAQRWGWDDALQETIHRERWNDRPWSLIILDDKKIGTLSIYDRMTDSVRFGEFYLLPHHQNRGIGTRVLEKFLADCDTTRLTVELEYLKWNPVGSLHKRHGFVTYDENDTHYFLRRVPSGDPGVTDG